MATERGVARTGNNSGTKPNNIKPEWHKQRGQQTL
ncbi:hypothetical protein CCACVL1_28335 [Corchorus capsularis]|uniref:Uncharacterized protein n=1 Tax=Corchorus capsularis TaxID=210143 RepID=A0A1R3G6V4_COCAP|nr:hypothetical protein CCACVL1_28335 [Corchorus capsularis]